MVQKKVSVSIPYKQRLDNLAIAFEGLANQTMDPMEFEIVVGAMEYCSDFVELCKKFTNKINIVSVLSADDFSIPRARNLAMRQATGNVLVQMDADTLLPNNALQNLYDRHFAFGQNICIVGQVVGYGNNKDGDVGNVVAQPYSTYSDALLELVNFKGKSRDPRFQIPHMVPWAFGWTGLIALPLDLIRKNNLFFDETFHGWGVDDLEWSFRICKSGIPIILSEDVCAIHLPHSRNQNANQKTEKRNYERFLSKWPRLDVELAYVFGDVKANSLFFDFMQEIRTAFDSKYLPGILRGKINSEEVLIVGVLLDENQQIVDQQLRQDFDNSKADVLPLLGMAMPYRDKEISETRILPTIKKFSEQYIRAVQSEVTRVSKKVVEL